VNPILPLGHFIPDVEARVWSDGRLYLYGSCDLPGNTAYCSYQYRVFSSADLRAWTDHGVSFRTVGEGSVPWAQSLLFAPDCVFHNGQYHLFFCTESQREGVASSPSPTGPFTDAVPVEGADGDGIDPAALVDDDGAAYLYWGQFHLRGAKLRPDLKGIEPATLQTSLLNEKEHGFHEGASIRKRNGIYYLVYTDISAGKATRLSYATSRSPLGPFTKGGVIVDNDGCDRESWNNHGSIAEFGGQWYVFYHRSSQSSRVHRRVCVEPIQFDAEGRISQVEMTTQGHTGPMMANDWLEAGRACLLKGTVRTVSSEQPGDDCPEHLGQTRHGDWAAYKYLDFGAGLGWFEAELASLTDGGTVEVRLDHPAGPRIGQVSAPHTGGWQFWQTVRAPVTSVSGVHALYLVFRGPVDPYRLRTLNLRRFRFGRNP
jgi:hypothetical protein